MSTAFIHSFFYEQLNQVIQGLSYNPHAILGLQKGSENSQVIRLWRPGAEQISLEIFSQLVEVPKIHGEGFFELTVPLHTKYTDYRIFHQNGFLCHDPYAFKSTFGELDQYLFAKGVHYQLYQQMGGRLTTHQNCEGAKFALWAPNAKSVSLVGDFNYWNGRVNPMRMLGSSGVWELFVPGLIQGMRYKFEIQTQQGEKFLKADPYALQGELRPSNASVLSSTFHFQWQDQDWIEKRQKADKQKLPMNIYEVHLGSWHLKEGQFLNYREIAHQLALYCQEMAFTHVELMPIQEHPLDESWGYQVSGFYATTSRFGTPEDFQYFVNYFHQNKIGVILDWVPGHFPTDHFSLGRFDGSCLYEHFDPRQGYHPHWSTYIFNFSRHEVTNFLIANALFWVQEMHVDGLRVDAVASMLYLDYGRKEGEWIANEWGGKENLQAIEFIKHLNSVLHQRCPGVLTFAEESTSFSGVTRSIEEGGLGFDYKWNMGWMNDTLRYVSKETIYRQYHHHDLTFGLIYAFSEKFVLVLSHDEVVHGKNSLMGKMQGDTWQKFANMRLLISYMICQPGKKLLFMGGEIGQWNEWNCKKEIEWSLLNFPLHQALHLLVKEINHFYLNHPSLWMQDSDPQSFEWVNFHDVHNNVISYLRKGGGEQLLCVHNFSPQYFSQYVLPLTSVKEIKEIFNSDAESYGGSNKLNYFPQVLYHINQQINGVEIALAPLATMIFKCVVD